MGAGKRILLIIAFMMIIGLTIPPSAMAFEADDLPFGFGPLGWQTGLSWSQENIKSLGLVGYEKTELEGFLTHSTDEQGSSRWFSGSRQVTMGNLGYTLELFVANTQRPILSTFMTSVDPHVGAYGEFNRMYGNVGTGLAGTAQLFASELGQFEYSISPYIQFTRQGVWRFSLSLGSSIGFGMSYQEPREKVKIDITVVSETVSFHVLLSMSELPLTLGAGLTQDNMQTFIRYSF